MLGYFDRRRQWRELIRLASGDVKFHQIREIDRPGCVVNKLLISGQPGQIHRLLAFATRRQPTLRTTRTVIAACYTKCVGSQEV
jgi:hypothetical protein